MWAPFPGNDALKLSSGGPKWGALGGGQKVYVEKVYVLFRSPTNLRWGRNYFCEGQKVPQSSKPQKIQKQRKSNEKITLGVNLKVEKKSNEKLTQR